MPIIWFAILYIVLLVSSQSTNFDVPTPPMGWITAGFPLEMCTLHDGFYVEETSVLNNLRKITFFDLLSFGYRYIYLTRPVYIMDRLLLSGNCTISTNDSKMIKPIPPHKKISIGIHVEFGDWKRNKSLVLKHVQGIDYVSIDINADVGMSSDLQTHGGVKFVACVANLKKSEAAKTAATMNWTKILHTCNSWRLMEDNFVDWSSILETIEMMKQFHHLFHSLVGTGRFNDLGLLRLGDLRLTFEQQRSQMAMWCLFASPLFISLNMGHVNLEGIRLLKNRHLIAINQDRGLRMPKFVGVISGVECWSRELFDTPSTFAIAFMNPDPEPKNVSMTLYNMLVRWNRRHSFRYLLADVLNGAPSNREINLLDRFDINLIGFQTLLYQVVPLGSG